MTSKALTTLVSKLRHNLGETAGVIGQQFDPSAPVTPLLEQRCAAVDRTLTQLWYACDLDETNTALIAVGGYGRGELFQVPTSMYSYCSDSPIPVLMRN